MRVVSIFTISLIFSARTDFTLAIWVVSFLTISLIFSARTDFTLAMRVVFHFYHITDFLCENRLYLSNMSGFLFNHIYDFLCEKRLYLSNESGFLFNHIIDFLCEIRLLFFYLLHILLVLRLSILQDKEILSGILNTRLMLHKFMRILFAKNFYCKLQWIISGQPKTDIFKYCELPLKN